MRWPFLFRLANKQDKMNALLGSELIELLSLERLVNQSRSLCHIVSLNVTTASYRDIILHIIYILWQTTDADTFLELMKLPLLSGALFSLNGSATLVWQEDSTRPSLVAACCLSGLSRAVYTCGPGQQETSGTKREGEEQEIRESSQKNQGGQVRQHQRIIIHFSMKF